MMRQIINYGFVLLFVIVGCKQQRRIVYKTTLIYGQRFITKRSFDKSGNIAVEEVLNEDSIRDGSYKEWSAGIQSCNGQYLDGKREGTWYFIDWMRDTIKIENWFLGKRFGQQVEFFGRLKSTDKPLIYRYSFTDLDGNELFTAVFNVDGKVESIKGIPLQYIMNKGSLVAGDTFELNCLLGIPERFSYDFEINEVDLKTKRVLFSKSITDIHPDGMMSVRFGKTYAINKSYTSRGKYRWKLKLELKYGKTISIADSVAINVYVH